MHIGISINRGSLTGSFNMEPTQMEVLTLCGLPETPSYPYLPLIMIDPPVGTLKMGSKSTHIRIYYTHKKRKTKY